MAGLLVLAEGFFQNIMEGCGVESGIRWEMGVSDENRVMKGGTRCRSVFTGSISDRGDGIQDSPSSTGHLVIVLVWPTGYLGTVAFSHPHYTRHHRIDPVFHSPYFHAP